MDIYAAGLVLFELCNKFRTQHERSERILKLRNDRKLPKDLRNNYKPECELILLMTDPVPDRRPKACELLKSDLLKGLEAEVNQE